MALFENMALRAKRVLVYVGMEAKACAVQYEWTSIVIRISKAVLFANGDIAARSFSSFGYRRGDSRELSGCHDASS